MFVLLAWLCACEPRSGEFAATPAVARFGANTASPAPSAQSSSELRSAAPDACSGRAGPAAVALPERVTFGDFWSALSEQIARLDQSALRGSFEAFAARHELDPQAPQLWQDFARLWVVFEATRDGGWWRLRWDVTDQQPSSKLIWKAWQRSPPRQSFSAATAVAECDEITALFSVTSRRLGVRGVGLFYPTWNHVIAGWAPQLRDEPGAGVVVLIPTTQIFQGCPATFDETTFKPPKHVYEFPIHDVDDRAEMPAPLAAFLLEQVRAYGEASPALLSLIRAKRAELLQSSLGDCRGYRRQVLSEVRARLSCADRRALRHVASKELDRPELSDDDVLSFLASP